MHFVAYFAAIASQRKQKQEFPKACAFLPTNISMTERTVPMVVGCESQIMQNKQLSRIEVTMPCSHFGLLTRRISRRRGHPWQSQSQQPEPTVGHTAKARSTTKEAGCLHQGRPELGIVYYHSDLAGAIDLGTNGGAIAFLGCRPGSRAGPRVAEGRLSREHEVFATELPASKHNSIDPVTTFIVTYNTDFSSPSE
jgi:hypothetical protein